MFGCIISVWAERSNDLRIFREITALEDIVNDSVINLLRGVAIISRFRRFELRQKLSIIIESSALASDN